MRVDFAFDAHDRIAQAVRTTEKQVTRGNRVLVYTTDLARLKRYDRALWSLPGATFLAHDILSEDAPPDLPVYLIQDQTGCNLARPLLANGFWLLNLHDECPPLEQPVTRILEIVSSDDDDRALARNRWRSYQQAGYRLHAHQLPSD
ncbi:DNA polymerase III subunit chi [Orrella marina]|uniref:DNA polymerase III subunit chi n=1 Tax=Orrella marina TaxID=2163011 RepID=A0A2R4XJ11_9BURK|nr:DNA polymerase III subunit chi [Orrella marina]AWB33768.1 DNA polymerase III subunit chi [Orrella marina]